MTEHPDRCGCAICSGQTTRDDLKDQIVRQVKRVGWFAIAVTDTDPELHWSYTIGLPVTLQHPELIVAGLNQRQAYNVLRSAATLIAANGVKLGPTDRVEHLIPGYDAAVREVSPENVLGHLGWSVWFHNREREGMESRIPTTMQIVWPDMLGRFPWQDGCSIAPGRQPILDGA